QTAAHCSRFLYPYGHRHRLRRLHPRAPLSMRRLRAHGFAAAEVRLALLALQRHGDRAVSHGATAAGENSRRRAAAIVALPARPVLAAPLPRASRGVVRRARLRRCLTRPPSAALRTVSHRPATHTAASCSAGAP